MSKRIFKNNKPRPTNLIKISSIEINENDSFDKLIVCASKFEQALKKTGATSEDYDIINLFSLALQATKIDSLDETKNTIEETIEKSKESRREDLNVNHREYKRVDQRKEQVSRGYFQSKYR